MQGRYPLQTRRTMKCTGERVVRFFVCLQVVRPFPVVSTVIRPNLSIFKILP